MNEIVKIFYYDTKPVRVVVKDNEPWFVAKDIADILGYEYRHIMYNKLNKSEKKKINPREISYNGNSLEPNSNVNVMMLVNEKGVYNSMLGVEVVDVFKFKNWIVNDVILNIKSENISIIEYKGDKEIMKNDLQIFNYQNNNVRTVIKDGESWFVAKDVCDILEISKHRDALSRLPNFMRGSVVVDTLGGKQEMGAVTEAGVYKLVFSSRKPEAEKFTDWLAIEVIPSIRKHGAYITPIKLEEMLNDPDTMIKTLQVLKKEREEKQKLKSELTLQSEQLKLQEPKVKMYDRFMDASGLLDLSEVGQSIGISANKLCKFLRDIGIFSKQGKNNSRPMQKHIDDGLFKVKLGTLQKGNNTITTSKTFVTAKGVEYITNLVETIK